MLVVWGFCSGDTKAGNALERSANNMLWWSSWYVVPGDCLVLHSKYILNTFSPCRGGWSKSRYLFELSSPSQPYRYWKPVLQENKDGSCKKPLPLILRWLSTPGGFAYCTQEQENSVTLVGQRQAFTSPHCGLKPIGKFCRRRLLQNRLWNPKVSCYFQGPDWSPWLPTNHSESERTTFL